MGALSNERFSNLKTANCMSRATSSTTTGVQRNMDYLTSIAPIVYSEPGQMSGTINSSKALT